MSYKRIGYVLAFSLVLGACASKKNRAEKINTEMAKSDAVSGDTAVGVNKDGDMVIQRKVSMNEEVRRIQYDVYGLEDRVYGNRKYGSLGLYGVLRDCKVQISDPKNGGDGKLQWTEPIDRVTDKEDDFKIGLDEKDKLVGVSEEYLKDRLERFKGYKKVLQQRQDEYEEKVEICKADLHAREAQVKKVEVSQ